MEIQRSVRSATLSLTNSASTTPAILVGDFEKGRVHVPTGSSITSLTFHDSPTEDGTFLPSYDSSGSAISLTVQGGRSYQIPASVMGASAIKMVANTTGDVDIVLKS